MCYIVLNLTSTTFLQPFSLPICTCWFWWFRPQISIYFIFLHQMLIAQWFRSLYLPENYFNVDSETYINKYCFFFLLFLCCRTKMDIITMTIYWTLYSVFRYEKVKFTLMNEWTANEQTEYDQLYNFIGIKANM